MISRSILSSLKNLSKSPPKSPLKKSSKKPLKKSQKERLEEYRNKNIWKSEIIFWFLVLS